MHVSSNKPVSEDEKADDVFSRRHLYCGTPVVTSWAVAGQQVVFLHMYLQTRVTLRAFPVATPRGRSSSSHGGEQQTLCFLIIIIIILINRTEVVLICLVEKHVLHEHCLLLVGCGSLQTCILICD